MRARLQSLLTYWKEQLLKDSTIHKIFVIILLLDQAEMSQGMIVRSKKILESPPKMIMSQPSDKAS